MNSVVHVSPTGRFTAPYLALLCGLTVLGAQAADWREWRGPKRDDHSPDTGLLAKWPEGGPKRLWVNNNVGFGYAGFSVVDGKLHTMGLRDEQEFLLTLNATTGEELRAVVIGPKYENRTWGNGPRGTPTVAGNRIVTLGGQGSLVCVDADTGRILWQKSYTEDFKGELPQWGYTESPLVVGDKVFCTPGGGEGTMAALSLATGEVVWRSSELTDAAHYSSPILAMAHGKPQVIQLIKEKIFGLDPSTGKVLWRQDWPGRTAVIPTPIFHDNHVYITTGYGVGCRLIHLGADGSATTVYDNKVMKNHHGGVILVGQHLYGYSDGPGWVCQDFKTGEEVWASKALGKGAIHFADGRFYCLDESSGDVALIEASSEGWKENGRFTLEAQSSKRAPSGRIWTHPVVVNGRLYLRDQEFLSCYDVKG